MSRNGNFSLFFFVQRGRGNDLQNRWFNTNGISGGSNCDDIKISKLTWISKYSVCWPRKWREFGPKIVSVWLRWHLASFKKNSFFNFFLNYCQCSFFRKVCSNLRSFVRNVQETGTRQYNVAICSASFCSIGIKNLQIARQFEDCSCPIKKIIDYVVFDICLENYRRLASLFF